MKVLQIHNFYQFSGGEDIVLENEYDLLARNGNAVVQYTRDNDEIRKYSLLGIIRFILTAKFSLRAYKEITAVIRDFRPNVCHIHNTFPLISPSAYYACHDMNVPVVQTLHNYRVLCSNACLFRDGQVCEECLGKSLYHSVRYGCYHNSSLQTLVVSSIIEYHKKKGTWQDPVGAYIALTEFSRKKLIEGGLPEGKIFVKPNCLAKDPGLGTDSEDYFLFVGRLDINKGVQILIDAFDKLENRINLFVAGDGPLRDAVVGAKNAVYLGHLGHEELITKLKKCSVVIFPSVWYECMPMTIIESFACGKPVIASNLGVMAELIDHGRTGLLFDYGDTKDLVSKCIWAKEHPEEMNRMGMNARKEFQDKYTAAKNYDALLSIYETVIKSG
jgi:glycosyltransferase involved in cell wall biosynthesis